MEGRVAGNTNSIRESFSSSKSPARTTSGLISNGLNALTVRPLFTGIKSIRNRFISVLFNILDR